MPWRFYKDIPNDARGIYIIEDDLCRPIYVGKGWIRTRQSSHWPKMGNDETVYNTAPKGWRTLRENTANIDPSEWTIYYTELESETALTALEGSLIHLLQPLANNETYKDSSINTR